MPKSRHDVSKAPDPNKKSKEHKLSSSERKEPKISTHARDAKHPKPLPFEEYQEDPNLLENPEVDTQATNEIAADEAPTLKAIRAVSQDSMQPRPGSYIFSTKILVLEDCLLEYDLRRGVLYVHNKETGATVLRICGIETVHDLTSPGVMLDVNLRVSPEQRQKKRSFAEEELLRMTGALRMWDSYQENHDISPEDFPQEFEEYMQRLQAEYEKLKKELGK